MCVCVVCVRIGEESTRDFSICLACRFKLFFFPHRLIHPIYKQLKPFTLKPM